MYRKELKRHRDNVISKASSASEIAARIAKYASRDDVSAVMIHGDARQLLSEVMEVFQRSVAFEALAGVEFLTGDPDAKESRSC